MNIVTIDFDIIMGPSIEGYNDIINDEIGMTQLCEKFPYFNNAKPDLYVYEYLTRFLVEASKKIPAENFYFISTHDLMYHICDKLNEEVEITNFDHHHDILYNGDFKDPTLIVDAGNWVKALFDIGKLKEYTWIGNVNSVMYDSKECPFENKIYRYILKDFPMGDLANNTDMVVCCFSENYVPEIYQPLFLVWRAIIEEQFNKDYLIIDNKDNL